jgi:UDP-N-acetylglucosamine 1-carboxyvinyltransferase
MSNFIINGGKKLHGEIKTNSAKNSAVAILCASSMIKGMTTLTEVPNIEEVKRIIEVLVSIGMEVTWINEHELKIVNSGQLDYKNINQESFLKTRSGLLLIGALCASFKEFFLPKASGCRLGKRTVSPYSIALEHIGIKMELLENEYKINKSRACAAEFTMYETADTATENTIMAAVLIPGITKIHFASSNYMTQDLCFFLEAAGAKISGIGTSTLEITGIEKLDPVESYPIMPDPIESMAFMATAITTGSKLKITGCPIDFLRLEIEKLELMGQKFNITEHRKSKNGKFDLVDIGIIPSELNALPDKLHPLPYPGLNIDNLPLFLPILTQTNGQTLVHDWVYENRAIYYTELNKLGADIVLHDQHRVTVTGPTKLTSAEIICPPALRPSINLLICMLAAEGKSILRNSYSIDRGYENIVERLKGLGANIELMD